MARLWDKGQPLDSLIADFTVGDDPTLDLRLLPHDVAGSRAQAQMLFEIGVLDASELAAVQAALDEALATHAAGAFRIEREDEDVHTALERFLVARAGAAGLKIHTGRSRNDQVLTDLRLWQRQAVTELDAALSEAISAFQRFAVRHGDVPLPGYTHLQRAMPSTIGRWAGAWATLLAMGGPLLVAAKDLASASPLGSAAGYGVPDAFGLDRASTARTLDFDRVLEPAEAAQPSRGKAEAALLFACTQIARDIGRWGWDLCLYTMEEQGFLRLPTAFTTGSSLMPQKRNPDVAELCRAKAAVVRAALFESMSIDGPLPSGYHRDLQLLKAPLFRGVDTTMQMLAVVAHVMDGLGVDEGRCRAAMGAELYATEEALKLVRAGVPFREAYKEVGLRWAAKRP